jgi:hypothetical protein
MAAVHHAANADFDARARVRTRREPTARAEWQRFGGAARGSELYNAEQLANSLSDPIHYNLFVDPVIASSGHTFERGHIVEWLRRNSTCPITRVTITKVLVTNHLAKAMVEQFIAAYATRKGDEWGEIRKACEGREAKPLDARGDASEETREPTRRYGRDEAVEFMMRRAEENGHYDLSESDVAAILSPYHKPRWSEEELDLVFTHHASTVRSAREAAVLAGVRERARELAQERVRLALSASRYPPRAYVMDT